MSNKHAVKIIALDFDGCVVTNKYPEIGEPIEKNIQKIKYEIDLGAKVILWTCRVGEMLEAAVKFCKDNDIRLHAVNENIPEIVESFGSDCRKIFANEYWDDRAVWMSEYDIGTFSNGYHTFDDLYEQRLVLSAALFNVYKDKAWKSRKHSDGQPCFCGEYFIVGIDTPLGPYTYHYENCHWDMFNCKELDMAPEWDGHTDKDVHRLMSLGRDSNIPEVACTCEYEKCCDSKEAQKPSGIERVYRYIRRTIRRIPGIIRDIFEKKSNMQTWAEREIEIACKHERAGNDTPDGEWDYGCACYESALKAFRSLTKDGHSGFSIGITKHILNRLIDGKPLTPIEDVPESWNDVSDRSCLKGEEVKYQCRRMSALFKYVYADGSVKYKNIDSHYCINIHNQSTYHSGLVQRIMDEMYPITMPYMPGEPIKVYCEDILTDKKNGDFDTVAVFYAIKPDGEKIEINRFFKEAKSDTGWDEITKEEYAERKVLAANLKGDDSCHKTCDGCVFNKENCTNPFDCIKDDFGFYTRYKSKM